MRHIDVGLFYGNEYRSNGEASVKHRGSNGEACRIFTDNDVGFLPWDVGFLPKSVGKVPPNKI